MMLSARTVLADLRRIGWANWDPIGLKDIHGGRADDEYDSYLIAAVAMIVEDMEDGAVIDYLTAIERDHMGLGECSTTSSRASATVAALRTYLLGLVDP